jgi:hypothetical protein
VTTLVDLAAAGAAVAFVVAAITKVDGWPEWRALAGRVVPAAGGLAAITVPVAEVSVALTTVVDAAIGLRAGAALLAAFVAVLTTRYRALQGLSCNCFGAAHASTIGLSLLARNAILAGVLLSCSFGAPTGAIPQLAVCSASLIVVALLLLASLRRAALRLSTEFNASLLRRS